MAAQCSPVRLPKHPSHSSIRSSHTCSFGRALRASPTPYRTNARPYRTSNGIASRWPWSLEKDSGPFPYRNSDSLRRHYPASKAVVHIEMSTPLIKNASDSEETDSAFPRRMLETIPYSPPVWAEILKLKPQDMFCLGQFPTPIHRWHLPNLPAGTEVYIKRDDLTGMQLSGNKVRKLEFLLADAKRQGADCVITVGGIQSNHCRATAVAARYAGLDSYLILRTNGSLVGKDPGLVGNLMVERMVGAHIELVSKENYMALGAEKLGAILAAKLESCGKKPYFIPVGGSNSLGSWGYIEAVREIERQLSDGSTPVSGPVEDIVVACGSVQLSNLNGWLGGRSGGTTAGLALACHLSNVKAKVHSFGVCDDPDYFYDYVQGLMDGIGEGYSSRDLASMLEAKGVGYAMSTSEELELVRQVALSTGIILDPVYSGKALKALLDSMAADPGQWEGHRVLFIHTGGLLGMFDKVGQLQPLMDRWQPLDLSKEVVAHGEGRGKMF